MKTPTALFDLLRSGRCDAAVYDAPILGAEQAGARPTATARSRAGIATGERYGIVVEKGSKLLGPLNGAVNALVRDGTVARLSKRWLAADPAKLRTLERADGMIRPLRSGGDRRSRMDGASGWEAGAGDGGKHAHEPASRPPVGRATGGGREEDVRRREPASGRVSRPRSGSGSCRS